MQTECIRGNIILVVHGEAFKHQIVQHVTVFECTAFYFLYSSRNGKPSYVAAALECLGTDCFELDVCILICSKPDFRDVFCIIHIYSNRP